MKTILIVEDELAYLKLLCDQLVKSGYKVIDAKNGEEGLKLALEAKPDLILLDLLMPKVGGLEMLKKLRTDQWGKDAAVYVITNMNQSKEISQAMDDKVNRYIVKSDWKLDDIIADIKLHLDRG